jgi:hypothetical protein
LCQLAIAELRRGKKLDTARKLFEEACERDREHFGAQLGLGAVLSSEQHGWRRLVRDLAPLPAPHGIERLVPDWPALEENERKVVALSVAPLAREARLLAEAGQRVLILPVDVRVTDIPELAHLADERVAHGDRRSYAAIGGIASMSSGVACAKIESLLDITQSGWTFAHEFAHLAERMLPEDRQAELTALYERALKVEYAFSPYQLRNQHELFAVAYTDWLCDRFGILSELQFDDEGTMRAVFDFFDALTI